MTEKRCDVQPASSSHLQTVQQTMTEGPQFERVIYALAGGFENCLLLLLLSAVAAGTYSSTDTAILVCVRNFEM